MPRLLLFNKPYRVLTTFTDDRGRTTLKDYIDVPGVYAAGRLDYDSEGLLLLTDHGPLQHWISHPRYKLPKTYWTQVEHVPADEALAHLRAGVAIKGKKTRPADAQRIDPPTVWPRQPPIRERKSIPTAWVELTIREGRNRQVRRMTAAVGHPTLRLIRTRIGPWGLRDLAPGTWTEVRCPTTEAAFRQMVTDDR